MMYVLISFGKTVKTSDDTVKIILVMYKNVYVP